MKADFSDSFNHDRKIILTVDMNRMLLMSHIEHARTVEVIGNIHDNPELLKEA